MTDDTKQLNDEEQDSARQMIYKFLPKTPYLAGLGVVIDKYEPDDITIRLPFREDLTNDGTVYHGGVIAAVIDTAGAAAAFSNHDFNKGSRASTVSMSIQYVGTAKKSDLLAHATAVKRGKELIFTQITATDEAGSPVAHAVQTYRIAR